MEITQNVKFLVILVVIAGASASTIGMTVSTVANLTTDVDDLQTDLDTSLGDYDTILTQYEDLLSNYTDLLTTFNILSLDNTLLNETYTELLADFNNLQEEYDALVITYDTLYQDYQDLQASHATLQEQYDTLSGLYDSLLLTYTWLQADFDILQQDFDNLQIAFTILQGQYDSLATIISQTIYPVQVSLFAEAVRRYYFEDFYVQNKYNTGNESGYWTEFARFCRDIILHDSNQKAQGVLIAEGNGFLTIPTSSDAIRTNPMNLEEFVWFRVDGISRGDDIKLTGTFTNYDTDFLAFWSDSDNSTWYYQDDLFRNYAGTATNPEVASFLADRDGSLMIGIFDYSLEPGIWNVKIHKQSGLFSEVSNAFTDIFQFSADTELLSVATMRFYFTRFGSFDLPVWGYDYINFIGSTYPNVLSVLTDMIDLCNSLIDYELDYIVEGWHPWDYDYIKFSGETAFRTMGDCEDQAILTAAYLESCGFDTAMLVIHDDDNTQYGSLYHGALLLKLDNMTEYQNMYPGATVMNMAYWDPTWTEGGVVIDTTWDTPFGTDPAWLQYYLDNYLSWLDLDDVWTISICDVDGMTTYSP